MRKPLVPATVFLLAAAGVQPCRAQIVAPLLEKHAVEVGYAYKWFDRDVPAPVDQAEWQAASLFSRFGAFDWLTLSVEGGLWSVEHEGLPDEPYTRWVVGGGVSARVYDARRWTLTATLAYNEIFDHDNSNSRFDKRTRGWNGGVLAGTSLVHAGQRLDVWAGPMFVDDLIQRYAFGVDDPIEVEPDTRFGAAAGAYAVLFDYLSAFGYVLHADHAQFRVGVSVRSRGQD